MQLGRKSWGRNLPRILYAGEGTFREQKESYWVRDSSAGEWRKFSFCRTGWLVDGAKKLCNEPGEEL